MENEYISEIIDDIDLRDMFDCGQCFRWYAGEDGSYTGTAMHRKVRVRLLPEPGAEKRGRLAIWPCDEREFNEIWRPYFDLDRDYSAIKARLTENDEIMARAVEYGGGIRILKQDPWEAIVDFIISQNNNIPRIKGCVENLCKYFGEPIEDLPSHASAKPLAADASGEPAPAQAAKGAGEGGAASSLPGAYDIPSPEKLAGLTVEDLAPIRLGYRAKYLIKTARQVVETGIPSDYDALLALEGVGPKVANCIALFGLAAYESFPIDVWVRKVMHALYGLDEDDKKAMAVFARERFGELGGFAQQYLFYYMRDTSK
ncbi:MAG: DNA glycosylase [Eubacteriales bacterium]|nr:DNA glycosylase [Eubacteriales bacterium]